MDLLTNVKPKKLSKTNTRSCKENQTKGEKVMICAINLSVLTNYKVQNTSTTSQ